MRPQPLITLIAVILLGLAHASADEGEDGNDAGNGTDVLVCPPGTNIKNVELLDFYELRTNEKSAFYADDAAVSGERVSEALKELDKIFFEYVPYYEGSAVHKPDSQFPIYRSLPEPIKISKALIKNAKPLIEGALGAENADVDWKPGPIKGRSTYGQAPLPHMDCKIERLINQVVPGVIGEKRFTISRKWWDQLTPGERMGAIIHEAIYAEAMKSDPRQNSILARNLAEGASSRSLALGAETVMANTLWQLGGPNRTPWATKESRLGFYGPDGLPFCSTAYPSRNSPLQTELVTAKILINGSPFWVNPYGYTTIDDTLSLQTVKIQFPDLMKPEYEKPWAGTADDLAPLLQRCGVAKAFEGMKVWMPYAAVPLRRQGEASEFRISDLSGEGGEFNLVLRNGQKIEFKGTYRGPFGDYPRTLEVSVKTSGEETLVQLEHHTTITLVDSQGHRKSSGKSIHIKSDCSAVWAGSIIE